MNKQIHKPFLTFVFIWLTIFAFSTPSFSSDSLLPQRVCLVVTETPENSQTVTWRSPSADKQASAQIAVLNCFDKPDCPVTTLQAGTVVVEMPENKTAYTHHSITFEGLSQDTWYTYRVGTKEAWSEWNRFKTAAGQFKPFTFIYLGDLQNEVFSKCSQVIRSAFSAAPQASFWMIGGDLTDHGFYDDQWEELFNAFGWLPRSYPLAPVVGNHEYPNPKIVSPEAWYLSPLWLPHFDLPLNGPVTLKGSCYFFVFQDLLFAILNGNEQLETQAEWLDRLLESKNAQRVIVAIHQPVYSTSKKRDNTIYQDLLVPIYDKYGVDLVLQGHDHAYSRSFPLKNHQRVSKGRKGTVYLMSVAGPKSYPIHQRHNHLFEKTAHKSQWYHSVMVKKNTIQVTTYNLNGTIDDTFEITER